MTEQKQWHALVTPGMREKIVKQIVQVFSPLSGTIFYDDGQTFAEKLEQDIYMTANDRVEYYYLLEANVNNVRVRKISIGHKNVAMQHSFVPRSKVPVLGLSNAGPWLPDDKVDEPPMVVFPEQWKLIQQQLSLLLHAHMCMLEELDHAKVCYHPHCEAMKKVLKHLSTCTAGNSCSVEYCLSSNQIIKHWKTCSKDKCPVCNSFRIPREDESRQKYSFQLNDLSWKRQGELPELLEAD